MKIAVDTSFVCEIPLRATQAQARVLGTRLEVARQLYNAHSGKLSGV